MKKSATFFGVAAVAAMIAAPVAAADRFSAPVANESEMGGGSTLLFAVVAGLALLGAIILITEDDDEAVSP